MRTILIPMFVLLICLSAFGQSVQNTKAIRIDSLLQECHRKGIFNGVALVADEGKVILHKSYGLADRERKIDLIPDDRFYIGSITKQFTAALILKLQEQSLLHIDHPISRYLPEFADSQYQNITLHHLLTHSSGMDNYTGFSDFDPARDYSEAEMIALVKTPLRSPPGTKWYYSNSGYYLLGKIAERAAGKSYGTLLEDHLFAPLQMEDTGFDTLWLEDRIAKGYWRTVDGFAPMPDYSLHTLFASGGIYSTAADLFKWDQALYGDQILSENSKNILFTPFLSQYACGWHVKKGYDDSGEYFERHFHGGMIKGYHSFVLRRIPPRQVVILLDNGYNQEIQDIKNRIWSALIEEKVRDIRQMLSNLLFEVSAGEHPKAIGLAPLLAELEADPSAYEEDYVFEEYDINTVGYRLMERERWAEAELVLRYNLGRFPDSWNVYDSLGELLLKMGNREEAKLLYQKSLEINPENVSATRTLEKMEQGRHLKQ